MAFGHVSGEPTIIYEGSDFRLHVLDLGSGKERKPINVGGSSTLAIGDIDGESMIVAGEVYGGSLQMWRARSGRRRGKPLGAHEPDFDEASVASLVVGEVHGHPVIISAGSDGVVHVWNPRKEEKLVTVEPGGAIRGVALGSNGDLAIATTRGLMVIDLLLLRSQAEG
jgi:WD40 repeat protein